MVVCLYLLAYLDGMKLMRVQLVQPNYEFAYTQTL
jgi:hypothetical protein